MTVLDKHGAVPLYLQLKRLIESQIVGGSLTPHSRVPSERELSEQFGISRMTARQALAELIQEGRLYTSAGKGTFVAEPKISQSLQSLTSFTEDMRTRGLTPSTRIIRRELIRATPALQERLRLPDEALVVCIERLRLADEEPLALETACLSFPGMERLIDLDLGESLYAVLRQEFSLVPTEALQEFEAVLPQPRERQLLHLTEGAPVLKLQRTTFDLQRRPFEYVQSVYRGDRYRFVARLIREGVV